MHAHERTYLSSIGFHDRDRGNKRHELACQYLAFRQAEFMAVVWPLLQQQEWQTSSGFDRVTTNHSGSLKSANYSYLMEEWLQYEHGKNFIARADLILSRDATYESEAKKTLSVRDVLGVEVKITPAPVSDILAQIGLYRSLKRASVPLSWAIEDWCVVTDYELNLTEKQTLDNAGIKHVVLGPLFDVFVAEHATPDTSKVVF